MGCSTRKTKQIDLWMAIFERRANLRPHPCVTASPLSLEERALARVSKDGIGAFMVRDARRRAPHHEDRQRWRSGYGVSGIASRRCGVVLKAPHCPGKLKPHPEEAHQ